MSEIDTGLVILDIVRVTIAALGLMLAAVAIRFAHLRRKAGEDTWIDYTVHAGFLTFVAIDQLGRLDQETVTWRLPAYGVLVLFGTWAMRRRIRLGMRHVPSIRD